MSRHPTIGVFDSGFGGLTVLRELLPLIPGAHYVYLGDTARLPYGAKSQQTIARYTLSSAQFLAEQGAELLVVACNTASALAMDELRANLSIPVIGVIDPGVKAASSDAPGTQSHRAPGVVGQTTNSGAPRLDSETWVYAEPTVLVLATNATVQSAAYSKACQAQNLKAYEKACPLLVPLVEEGWTAHPVTAEVVRIYLSEALAAAPNVTTLLLGCTHYPLLEPLIASTLQELGHPLLIVNSAKATARAAAALIATPPTTETATITCYATDFVEKFQRLGSQFLGQPLEKVELIDLGG